MGQQLQACSSSHTNPKTHSLLPKSMFFSAGNISYLINLMKLTLTLYYFDIHS